VFDSEFERSLFDLRKAKLEEIVKLGQAAYPNHFSASHTVPQVRAQWGEATAEILEAPRVTVASRVIVSNAQHSQKGLHCKTLYEDRKNHDTKGYIEDLIAIGKGVIQAQSQSECQSAAQAAPNGHMLPTKWNSLGEEVTDGHQEIDRKRAPDEHGGDGEKYRTPCVKERAHVHFQSDEQKHQRVYDERDVFPKRLHSCQGSSTHALFGTKIANHQIYLYNKAI